VRLLLDTHALLCWFAGDNHLSMAVKTLLELPSTQVLVSAASAWEISTKHRLGRLPGAGPLATDFVGCVRGQGFAELPITWADAQRAGSLPGKHRDPFDRMLAA